MIDYLNKISFFILVIASLLCLVRLVKGPSPVDRVMSLDLLALIAGGLLAVHSVRAHEAVFLDAILILSLIAFLGTIVFARFIESQMPKEGTES